MNFRRLLRSIKAWAIPSREPVILMYHRIAEPLFDPWALSVSPSRFAEQIDWLKRHRLPMSMDEFVSRLIRRELPSRAVAITFDDGYRDNLLSAKPVLERERVPATVFVATEFLGSKAAFWWDELVDLILARRDAADMELRIPNSTLRIVFSAVRTTAELSPSWRAWEAPVTERQRCYLNVWGALRQLGDVERCAAMRELRQLLGHAPAPSESLPMERKDIALLIEGGIITIGGHTRTHPALGTLEPDNQRDEIESGRLDCQQISRLDVPGFAYPYGNLGPDTAGLVRGAGFQWACSTESLAVNRANYSLFSLPRLQVENWPAEQLGFALDRIAK